MERILNVELARLTSAIELNFVRLSLPERLRTRAPTTQEISEEMDARQPIIRWALNLWVKDAMGFDEFGAWCPTLRRMQLHPWQWKWPTAAGPALTIIQTPPTLVQALRALRPSLEVEIRRGLRTSPLRVARLAFRSILVYLLAALSFLPGPTQPLIQRTWPRIVEHLATTLETNHRLALEGTETAGMVLATTVGSVAETASPPALALLPEGPRRQLGSRVGLQGMLSWADGPLASVQHWLRSRGGR